MVAISLAPASFKQSKSGRFDSTAVFNPFLTASDVIVCRFVAIPNAAKQRINAVEQPVPI